MLRKRQSQVQESMMEVEGPIHQTLDTVIALPLVPR